MRKFLNKLHWQVAIALVLAIVLAVFMRWTGLDKTPFGESTEEFLSFIGKLFMRILSMIVVPLVFTSVVCGSMSLGGGKRFLRIGIKTVVFYLATGVAAIILTLLLVNFISQEAYQQMLQEAYWEMRSEQLRKLRRENLICLNLY